MRLEQGQVAFVTGGASGIGFAIAQALSERGLSVMLADIDPVQLSSAGASLGPSCRTVQMDVRNRADWHRARTFCEDQLGPVDLLVNNAGIAPDGQELADMNPDSFDRIVAINLTGVFNGIREFGQTMRNRAKGHIVNTASMAGVMSSARLGGYTATKFAVMGMSEVLCKELAPHGVGVSILCPGLVQTRLRDSTLALGGETAGSDLSGSVAGIDPRDVGQRTIDAIEANDLYIFTHGEYRDFVARRGEKLLKAIDATPPSTMVGFPKVEKQD